MSLAFASGIVEFGILGLRVLAVVISEPPQQVLFAPFSGLSRVIPVGFQAMVTHLCGVRWMRRVCYEA